jgi:transcriptional regulator with XRE-family HTH domain
MIDNDQRQKLTDDEVAQIRRLYSSGEWTQYRLADRYGVTQGHISLLLRSRRRQP